MAASSGSDSNDGSLVVGSQLRCPNCGVLGHPFRDFKPLELVDRYRRELNPVYKHALQGGCGHVFSPGDPWIIEAYLAGDLVPKAQLAHANDLISRLTTQLEELTAYLRDNDKLPEKVERRVGIA
jgi:hypothetical protein